MRRLPAAVADLAEGLWQRALSLATEAARASSTPVDEQLTKLKSQVELRSHTLSQREVELDELLRSRERTVKELEEHLRVALSMLNKRDLSITSLETRLTAAHQETEAYRRRLAKVIHRAVVKQQDLRAKTSHTTRKTSPTPYRSRPTKVRRKWSNSGGSVPKTSKS